MAIWGGSMLAITTATWVTVVTAPLQAKSTTAIVQASGFNDKRRTVRGIERMVVVLWNERPSALSRESAGGRETRPELEEQRR